jgi:tetratricopeptide (TPR) repeat protein
MYLPNIGLLVTFALLLNMLHPFLWLALFGIHIGMLVAYLPSYRDLKFYLKHHTDTDPCNDVSWNFLINLASEENNVVKVLDLTEAGLKYNPTSSRIWFHRACALTSLGHYEMALQCIDKSWEFAEDVFILFHGGKIGEAENKIKMLIKEKKNGGK